MKTLLGMHGFEQGSVISDAQPLKTAILSFDPINQRVFLMLSDGTGYIELNMTALDAQSLASLLRAASEFSKGMGEDE